MAYNSKDVYRGKIRLKPFIIIPLGLLIFSFVLFLALFYGLQRYVVYEQDGVYIDFDRTQEEDTLIVGGNFAPVPVEIIYNEPDYTTLSADTGEEIAPIKAVYLNANSMSGGGLTNISQTASSIGANAIILEVKPRSGALGWTSSVPLAVDYGTNGTQNLAEQLATLSEEGFYLVASVSCLVDGFMATRNIPISLKSPDGSTFENNLGKFVDPTSDTARKYIADLSRELLAIGFDEILLKDLALPQTAEGSEYVFAQTGSVEITPELAILGFAMEVNEAVEGMDGKLSLYADAISVRAGVGDAVGQSSELIANVFDRVFWETDANYLQADTELISQFIPTEELDGRFVPVMYQTGTTPSWVYPYS